VEVAQPGRVKARSATRVRKALARGEPSSRCRASTPTPFPTRCPTLPKRGTGRPPTRTPSPGPGRPRRKRAPSGNARPVPRGATAPDHPVSAGPGARGCLLARAGLAYTHSSWLNQVERWFSELTTKKTAPLHPPQRQRPPPRHHRLGRTLERQPPPVHLAQDRRRDPRQPRRLSPTNQRLTTLGAVGPRALATSAAHLPTSDRYPLCWILRSN
jgi:hypothetical protein